MRYCEQCTKKLNRHQFRFCSNLCQRSLDHDIWINRWKEGKELGHVGKTLQITRRIRKYLFDKNKNKCQRCNWSEINITSGNIPLEVNHIDGDASNCKEENLELVCPNCHSLTSNFRNLNKSSKRQR